MTSLFKFTFLWFIIFGQVSVRAEGLYFSPRDCWDHHVQGKACQFANNYQYPKAINANIELVADKNGKGELEGETLFLLPGRYWISSAGSLKIQTRHGALEGKNFSLLIDVTKDVVRCHVVSGHVKTADEVEVVLGQSLRFDRDSKDVFTIAKEDLLENWKDILALSKRFVEHKRSFVQEWSRQTKILAQNYQQEIQRSIASAQEKEREQQLKAQKEQEAMRERRRLFREKNNLD